MAKCRKMQRGEKSSDGHSQECRKRVIELLCETEEFKDDVARTNRKLQEALARELERTISMEAPGQGEPARAASDNPSEESKPAKEVHSCRNPTEGDIRQGRPFMLVNDLATRHQRSKI